MCGHDVHMSAWVGTAELMAKNRDRWHGTLMLVGQPAEEIVAGATAMLRDGLFTRFPKPDYALGVHDEHSLPAGVIGFHAGYFRANSTGLEMTVYGKGGHGAFPQSAIDPVVIAARIVLGLQTAENRCYVRSGMTVTCPKLSRIIREPWARMLTGGSTGGWIALAHQVFYPDFYGGVYSLCPDGVDFRYHQIVNIYDDDNAYFVDRGWVKTERPNNRRPDGNIVSMMKDENWYELVQGDRSRSGGQWDIWEATYGPAGSDGYPQRLWDKSTGEIDKDVAKYWKEYYDLRHILESNWSTLGPKVANKINVYVGDADSYFLNMGVHKLDEFLTKADNPKWTGEIVFQPMAPHCWGPPRNELAAKMATQITKFAPQGADVTSWKY